MSGVRPSLAGQWYPADPTTLVRTLDEMLAGAPDQGIPINSLQGLIVPHAGHRYSGPVAAHAYRAIAGTQAERLIVLGPYHSYFPEPLLTSGFEAYQTPLGEVPIDRPALAQVDRALERTHGPRLQAIKETGEHSIEVQLPFLQRVLSGFRLVPIMLAEQTEAVTRRLATALREAFAGQLPLMLASSDLSHHHPQAKAEGLDGELLRRIERLDPLAVLRAEREGVGYACGIGAIATLLWAVMGGECRARVLHYATSGDVTGDLQSVVGYASVALFRQGETPSVQAAGL